MYEKGNINKLDQSKLCTIQTLEMSSKETNCLVWQLCDKNWHAAANTITNHSELNPKVLNSVNRNASNEMSEYLHDKIQKHAM